MDSYLTELGQKQAHCIGLGLAEQEGIDLDLILCSDLGRTRHTLLRVLASMGEQK